jgi:hypothetical protein
MKFVYVLIFLTSLIYAPLLSLWQRLDPISINGNTWLQVVFGVGYVLLYLRLLLRPQTWLRVVSAFFFASIPIIARSLFHNGQRNVELQNFNGRKRNEG